MSLKITALIAAISLTVCLLLRLISWGLLTFQIANPYETQWLFSGMNLIDMFLSSIPVILFFTFFFFTHPTRQHSGAV